MLGICLFIKICIGGLSIWSPDSLSSLQISNAIATFGDPFLLPRYGKLFRVDFADSCSFSLDFPMNAIAILYNFRGCYYSDLAISVQNSGGIGMISVKNNNNLNFIMVGKDYESSRLINILAISIKWSDGDLLAPYLSKDVWISYSYELDTKNKAEINYQMSSNYTKDKEIIKTFSDMDTKFQISLSDFSMSFCYLIFTSDLNYLDDCVDSGSNTYCLPGTSAVKGSQMIYNSAVILNYYNTLSGPSTIFFNFLNALYSTCEFDYSTACIQSVLTSINPNLSADLSLGSIATANPWQDLAPFYYINNNYYFWGGQIEKSYCLTLSSPPSNCEECSLGCSYSDLSSSNCKSACNTTSCSYDMLNCIGSDDCYNFMIGDGNCNEKCACDPDCGCDLSDICTNGCLYSDMQSDKCPLPCTGNCFSNCNSDFCSPECRFSDMASGNCPDACTSQCFSSCSSEYCSPGCTYSDLNAGICKNICTPECTNQCNNNFDTCSPGCKFSDMENGNCPFECTDICFKDCSTDFCSPGCLKSTITQDYCPSECDGKCCKNDNNHSGISLFVIVTPLVIGLFL